MSVKKFAGASDKKDVEKALEKRPCIVLFYMIGCPHCEANKPAWEELKKEAPEDTDILEVESEATPDSEGVSGFPTMKHKKEDGSEKVTTGEKSSAKEIADDLDLGLEKKKGSSRRSRALRRTHRRRYRKLRYGTLRNHISLRQKFIGSRVLPKKF